jgi:hypothetical protein
MEYLEATLPLALLAERLAKDKHSSLLGTLVNYIRKKFNIGPWGAAVAWQ